MKSWKIALPAALVMIAAAAGPALADPAPHAAGKGHVRHMAHGDHGDQGMERMLDRLGLSADQRAKIKALREQQKQASAASRQALMEKHRALMKLIRQKNATEGQALALQREIAGLQAQLAEGRLKAWFAARAVLTPEQLAKLEQLAPAGRPGRPGSKR